MIQDQQDAAKAFCRGIFIVIEIEAYLTKTRKISNKQPKLIPKSPRKGRTNKTQN